MTAKRTQAVIDAYYKEHGNCCAGCDWWRWHNSVVGECTRSAPVSGAERNSMLDMEALSITPAAGHVMTKRDHATEYCAMVADECDKSTHPADVADKIRSLKECK